MAPGPPATSVYGMSSALSLDLKRSRCAFSASDSPSVSRPNDRSTFGASPETARFFGSMHSTARISRSLSSRPNSPLHFGQLGAVQRWTLSGVVSGTKSPESRDLLLLIRSDGGNVHIAPF